MIRFFIIFLMIFTSFSHANDIEVEGSDKWQIVGNSHFVRSKEDSSFSVLLVSSRYEPSIVAIDNSWSCFEDSIKRVKIFYQWVNFRCVSGNVWIPHTKKGQKFVKEKFTSFADVEILFNSQVYTLTTKNFVSVRQQFEGQARNHQNAL